MSPEAGSPGGGWNRRRPPCQAGDHWKGDKGVDWEAN